MSWRMKAPCGNCPFSDSPEGKTLAKSLQPGRLAEIKQSLRHEEHFVCHKTTHETGDGTERICAGALNWQHEHGISSNHERVMGRLDAIFGRTAR